MIRSGKDKPLSPPYDISIWLDRIYYRRGQTCIEGLPRSTPVIGAVNTRSSSGPELPAEYIKSQCIDGSSRRNALIDGRPVRCSAQCCPPSRLANTFPCELPAKISCGLLKATASVRICWCGNPLDCQFPPAKIPEVGEQAERQSITVARSRKTFGAVIRIHTAD